MEKEIKDRFTDVILKQALASYGIEKKDVSSLDGFESYIYAFKRGSEKGILRISHSLRRTPELIKGEVDWISYLYTHGVRVARPLPSIQEGWVVSLADGAGGVFLAAAFEWAPGNIFQGSDWPPDLLHQYGKQLGSMHRLATTYQPADPTWKRAEWQEPINLDLERFIPEQDRQIRKVFLDLKEYLHSLPVSQSSYGLIHQDPHPGNFHVDQDHRITFFDFDDCAYSWFVNDIALVLFYTSMGKENLNEFIPKFLKGFLPAYLAEFPLDPSWFKEIPHFQKLREIDLYALIHRSFEIHDLDPWCSWYMDGRKQRLERGAPFLDFEWSDVDWSSFG